MKKVLFMLLAGTMLLFSNCTKTGPVGPQGPRGYDGNANVIGENSFSVSSWSYSTNEVAYVASFDDPNITNDVANYGLVMIYMQYANGTWRNLPDVVNGTMFSFVFYQGGFDILYTNVNGTTPSFPGTQTFRAVIVPSSVRKANPNTDWNNYDAAIKALKSTPAAPAVSE